jgi:hypothetical protein
MAICSGLQKPDYLDAGVTSSAVKDNFYGRFAINGVLRLFKARGGKGLFVL